MSSHTRRQLEDWLKTIEVRKRVLDVGGSANPLKGRVRVFAPKEYKILDNGSEEGRHPKWVKPHYDLNISDDIFLAGHNLLRRFDQAFMIEVSEYLADPIQALMNIAAMLKPGGEFYSSWHFIYCLHPPHDKDYFRYTPQGVEKLLEMTGFKVIEHTPRKTEVSSLREVWAAEQMRGWKNMDNSVIGSLIYARKA